MHSQQTLYSFLRLLTTQANSRLFQCANNYGWFTCCRVHTMGMPATGIIGQLFRGADLDTQLNVLARRTAQQMPGKPLMASKDLITNACVNTLYTYRRYCTNNVSSGQLILPEALKLLPVYSLALLKCPCFR